MTATTEPTAVTLSRKTVGTLYEGTSKVDLSLFSDHGLKYHSRFILDPTSKGTGCTTLLPGSRDAKMPPKFALFNLTADESRIFGDPSAPPDESEWIVQKVTCDEDLQAFRRPGPSEDFEFMEPNRGPEGGDTDRPGEPGTILTQWTFERTTVGEDGELIDTDELPQEAPAEFRNTVPEDGELIDTDELSQEARAELRSSTPCRCPRTGSPSTPMSSRRKHGQSSVRRVTAGGVGASAYELIEENRGSRCMITRSSCPGPRQWP